MAGQIMKYFYIDWESGGSKFLRSSDKITVTPGAQKTIRIHVFYNRSNPESLLLNDWDWISKHPSATDAPDAAWVALMSSLISDRKFLTKPNVVLYLVSKDQSRFMELISVIKTNSVASIVPINSTTTSITDCLDHVCSLCLIIFRDSSEKEHHDRLNHLLLCNNPACDRSRKGNGFWNKSELQDHVSKQRKCDICLTGLVFCSPKKKDEHMRSVHVRKLNANRNASSLDHRTDADHTTFHFRYSLYPLPCLAEPTCAQRFRTTAAQVFHHVSCHQCEFPYVCMACVNQYKRPVCLKSKTELLDHAKVMEHRTEEFIFTEY